MKNRTHLALLTRSLLLTLLTGLATTTALAQTAAPSPPAHPPAGGLIAPVEQTRGTFIDRFRQLDEVLPTANAYRNAAGAPGHEYWQQEASYQISVSLDEDARRVTGSETITYKNNSPDSLRYLWLQLDQNRFRTDSIDYRTLTVAESEKLSFGELKRLQFMRDFEGGVALTRVASGSRDLPHTVIGTLLRVDLPEPLKPGGTIKLNIDWAHNLVDGKALSPRSGYEHFIDDGNDIFLLAQWYPRMVVYSDYEGWHNKEFLGRGEFTLEFGDYDVSITVPADHVVSSTGKLTNPSQVLSAEQRARLKEAENAQRPVYVVTPEEALAKESERATDTRTWRFKAENVRDFAWASSRKFIWDAQGYQQEEGDNPLVMAMSFFPKEGDPLWSQYSTQAVIHTMEVYSRYSFPYPYPTAQSVNGPAGGMEYPMITFNGPRTELRENGERTYSRATKRFLIGVVIHEVGHFYFPMIVNSDERQWTWMDEGVNSFLQFIAEQEWEEDYPSRRGEARWIVDYMKSENQVPIMTNSESVLQFGNNAYGKPATALNILRETILGRERFDFAFREYSRRWMFKRPTPSDLFRTLEEASGVDLDWFWRGWFYSTNNVDISIDKVTELKVDSSNPDLEADTKRQAYNDEPVSRTDLNNATEGTPKRVERYPWLIDFYNENDKFTVSNEDRNKYEAYLESLIEPLHSNPTWKQETLAQAISDDLNYYVMEFSNVGGLVMPIILRLTFEDESTEDLTLPAEIWRRDTYAVKKLIARDKRVVAIEVDPHWETADVDVSNNHYPRQIIPSRLEIFDPPSELKDIPDRDLMHDVTVELKPDGDKMDGPDAFPTTRTGADDPVPVRRTGG